MKDTKLIELLKNLSKDDFKELEKFVASPYFRKERDLSPLLRIMKSFHPEFNSKNLNDEFIFKNLYPEKIFGDERSYSIIKTLTSELFKTCKEFLIQLELKNDVNRRNFYLLNQLRKKKLYREFEKEYNTSIEYQEKSDGGSPEDFINKYFLSYSYGEYCVEKGLHKQAYESIFKMGEYAAVAALLRGFRMSELKMVARSFCELNPVFNLSEYFIKFIDNNKFIKGIEKNNNKYFPLIEISYMIHKMTLDYKNQKHYFKLKELVDNNLNLLGREEKYMIFGIMGSYCVRMTNELNLNEFMREQFELYKKSLELDVVKWRAEDDFQLSLFRNIVLTGTIVNELDWVEDFIKKYSPELNIEYRSSMENYTLAYLQWARGEYEKALDFLIKVKYDFFLFKIDIKNLYFRIYYEMNLIEQAFSVLDTMRHYISNTKDLHEIFIMRSYNFIKYSSELLRLKSSGAVKDINILKENIRKEKFIESRRWLLAKADELKKF